MIMLLLACKTTDVGVQLKLESDLSFSGTFKTINSENLSGTVELQITNGRYKCLTSLPYGQGAGKVEMTKSTINFVDTLFLVVPAIYGPSYAFSGQHQYRFNGEKLEIWRAKNVGEVEYNLNLKK